MSAAKRLGAVAIVVFLAIAAAVSFSQSASAYPVGTAPTITLSHSSGPVGNKVFVTGKHFTPGGTATLSFHSDPVALGTVNVNGQGGFGIQITVPNVSAGAHTVQAIDVGSGQVASADFTITASGSGGTGGTGGGGGGLANTGVAVLGIAALGLVLLVGGGLMLMAGRRRKVVA